MVDLAGQYHKIKDEINKQLEDVMESSAFINGPQVKSFSQNLQNYLGVKYVIPCANGTDALQIALMALDLEPGDEVIIPAFNYVALAEVAALLRLKPVFVDCDSNTFNISPDAIEAAITPRSRVIAPVHLFGQCADMNRIMSIAAKHGLFVLEDTAQAIGANYTDNSGKISKAGTIGNIGTTSFFPSKNLGCYGDGGAIYTNDDKLGEKIKMIANHGQKVKYVHETIGVNSRLDTMQAAILNIKLNHLDAYNKERNNVADFYDKAFREHQNLKPPVRAENSTHVFHQYTLQICGTNREELRSHLDSHGIPTMVYYPIPLHKQKAYATAKNIPISETLSDCVLSLPISTEMDIEQLEFITSTIINYFKK